MSVSIDNAFIVAVDGAVTLAAQAMDSAFRGAVRVKPVTGKAWDVNTLGAFDLQLTTGKHQDTPIANPEHGKRRGQILDYSIGVLIDQEDELKTLINPQGEYTTELGYAQNRRFDRTVIAALNANVATVTANGITESVNAAGGVLTAFQGWDGTASVNHVIAHGSVGLTVAKVRQTKRLLDFQQAPQSGRHFVTSSYGLEDLLADPQVTSADFNTLRTLEAGTLNSRWMGFTWHFCDLMAIASNIQANFAWHESAIEVGQGAIQQISVDKRSDKNNAIQVLAKKSIGAVRKLENWVVECDIDTTA